MNEPAQLKVTVHRDGQAILQQVFERNVIKIGRLASAHVRLDDPAVSRIHAVLESAKDGYNLIDMGSAEGTFVNDQKVSKTRVGPGDRIRVGPYFLQLEGAAASAPPPTPPVSEDVPVHAAAAPASEPTGSRDRASQLSEAVLTRGPAMTGPRTPGWGAAQIEAQERVPTDPPSPVFQGPMGVGAVPVPGAESRIRVPSAVAWGSVPNNLASERVNEDERVLEVKVIWGHDTVLDSASAYDQPELKMGDERVVKGWGPLQKVERCDLEIPSRGLFAPSFVFARSTSKTGASYELQWPKNWPGRVERADGNVHDVQDILRGSTSSDAPELTRYNLQSAETLILEHGNLTIQARYVRRVKVVPIPLSESINYAWLNTFLMAFFFHVMAVFSFLATPQTQEDLNEELYKAVNRFSQIKLAQEKRKKNTLLSQLKTSDKADKAQGKQGKMGKKDMPKNSEPKRAASKGKPDDKEQAKRLVDKLFGAKGEGAVAGIFGGSGVGGELKSAMGGLQGYTVGDSSGLGGLGTRGSGPGGGGTRMTSVGVGDVGTAGRGGGGTGEYGDLAGKVAKKKDRDIDISAGRVEIRGSLAKEIIRRVIREHLSQIRYCYEKELQRTPGIFGKVSTQFTISGQGTVIDSRVTQTTLGNQAVERCITQKIRTWKFPKPKGGGIVVVNYPFVLKQSG